MPQWVRWLWLTIGILAVTAIAATKLGGFLILVALALLLATGLNPIVRFLERRAVPHKLAVPLTFLGISLAILVVISLLVPPLVQQGTALVQALPAYAQNLEWLGSRWAELRIQFAFLPSPAEIMTWISSKAWHYLYSLLSLTSFVVGLGVGAVTIAFMLYYMLKDGRPLTEQLLLLVPPYRRDNARALLTTLAERVGRFTLGTIADMSIVAALISLGLWVIGVPNALMLGVIAGILNILPYVGATIGSIPGLIVAFGISPQLGLMAWAVYIIVQELEGFAIYPRVVGNAVGLHPLYVLVALTVGTQLWGVVGVFLGIPGAVVLKTLMEVWLIPMIQRMTPPSSLHASTELPGLPTVTMAPDMAADLPSAERNP